MKFTRRTMLKTSGIAALGLFPSRVLGANNRINLAFIGVGSMGSGHVGTCSQIKDINIVAVCDVDAAHQQRAAAIPETAPKQFRDFREVLDLPDVDAVVVATPEHWHPHICVRAFEAGKDVYTEKPLGHNIREGRIVAEAAEKHGRICQVGLQQRSGNHWQNAVARIHAGELGKISSVHVWNAWNAAEMRGGFGNPADAPVPAGVNYDLWLGPAPDRPFNPARFHFTWCYFWDYSGGMLSGWGVHLFDIVHWAMGYDIRSVSAVGGKYVLEDSRETPDTLEAVFDCGKFTLSYSLRHTNAWRPHDDMDHGIEFFGDRATLQINRAGFNIFRDEDRASRKAFQSERAKNDNYRAHIDNFLEAVRSRQSPNCDALTGHRSTIYPHLANIAYRTGKKLHWDRANEDILDNAEAQKLLTREYRAPWGI